MKRILIAAAALLILAGGVAGYALLMRRAPVREADVATLQLEGRLVLAHITDGVVVFDLATGETEMLYEAPAKAWVTGAALSPDGSMLVFAYAPPPEGTIQYGFSDLATMPIDGSSESSLLLDAGEGEVLSAPTWSPDGRSVVFTRSRRGETGAADLSVGRVLYPDGASETVVEQAFSPAISPDGRSLAYISAAGAGIDTLYVSGIGGADARPMATDEGFNVIDWPRFSPDGSRLIFSAFKPLAVGSFEDRVSALLGVQIARAGSAEHSAPSDIWQIDLATGKVQMLADVRAEGIVLDTSPDGRYIAFITGQGIYIMAADGANLTRISEQTGYRSIQWIYK